MSDEQGPCPDERRRMPDEQGPIIKNRGDKP
jgi:hypothetical protein